MKSFIHLIKNKLSIKKMQFTIRAIVFLLLFAGAAQQTQAQCTGCTSSITNNNSNITVAAGQVVCITYVGTFTKTITFSGGTLCIGPSTTVSSAIVVPSGAALNVYGKVSGAFTNNGGTVTVYSAGIFNPSSTAFNSGTTTVNSGGSATFATAVSFAGGTMTNNGTMTFSSTLTNNGGTMTFSGTETFSSTVTNNNSAAIISINGPATVGTSLVVNSGTVNLSGGVTVSNNITNYGAITLSGALSVGGNYTSTGSLTASASGCNSMTVTGTITSNSSTYNGNGYSLAISPSTGCTSCMSNGAYNAPTTQPSALSASLSSGTVSGSFTAASASVGYYLVLRSIGTSAPSSSPVSGTAYSVGSTVGTMTVAAIVTGGTTGTLSFSDAITTSAANCGKNVYYRIFSFNGSGTCDLFYTTSPLTGSVAITSASASVSASGATTFCSGGSLTLTATGGTSYLWSNGATTAAISPTSTAVYTVTATNAAGCTDTAIRSVTVYSTPSLSTSSNTPVCVGSTATITATPSGSTSYTYSWSGPSSFTSTAASFNVTNANTTNSGNYNITVTDNHSCSVSATVAMYVNPNCVDSVTTGANGGSSSDAPCTEILRFDHYNETVASTSGGQNMTWKFTNGNTLTMTVKSLAGNFNAVAAPSWSGAGFGQTGYTGLSGKPVLYTATMGYSKVNFSNIQMKDSLGNAVSGFTMVAIDGESTDSDEKDTLTSTGTVWAVYDSILVPSVALPSQRGIGSGTVVWTALTNATQGSARMISTVSPTNVTISTSSSTGFQGLALGVTRTIQAPTATTICSNSSFNGTATNLPAGTTYTWSAPVISPAGSITGGSAQSTAVTSVSQTLVNTTSSPATATYTVYPMSNCSRFSYTVTVTVNPAPSAAITSNSPACLNTNLTATATAVTGGPQTYSWSGPLSYTATGSTFTISNAALTRSGTYTVTITGSNGCTASASSSLSVVNCLTVSGTLFDDAIGNGIQDGTDAAAAYGQTMYTVLADTNGIVMSTSTVASNGTFTLGNVLPNKSGMTVRVTTSNPSIGSAVPAASFPANWVATFGSYGVNNAAGTGVYNNVNELIPVKTTTVNITAMYIGYDRLQAPTSQAFTISHPALNTIKALTTAAGLGELTWSDPEDGANTGSFVVKSVANMHGNVLFYDSNNNNLVEASEVISGYRAIGHFVAAKMKIKFSGVGSSSASFTFGYIDAANKSNASASSYTISWTGGALPVKLEYFTAEKASSHSSLLKWATAAEVDNDHFEIERSADAQSWTTLGEVKGAGTTTEEQVYTYADEAPLNGVNYYRLKQVDIDGHYTYTNVQDVTFDGIVSTNNNMTMYPNPATASTPLTIELSNSSPINNVTITNSIGQVVYSDVSSQTNVLHLSGLNLSAGVYAVSVFTEGSKALTSLLVIK